jgi:hypothetical protein
MWNASIIIPAYNEELFIGETLRALRAHPLLRHLELIVVDDGSTDGTSKLAANWADQVIRSEQRKGKGFALWHGTRAASGDTLLFLDADLEKTSVLASYLLENLHACGADMVIGCPPAAKKEGFGLVKRMAQREISKMTGVFLKEPLSGQRALTRRASEAVSSWDYGFGIEVAMTIDIMHAGLSVCETAIPFSHRSHGKTAAGFLHRGKQYLHIRSALKQKQAVLK